MERGRSRLIELEEEEDDDEMKMEKFYSLVRKLREARKRLRDHQMIISNELKKNKDEDEEMNKKRKSLVSVEEQSSTTCWVPCFVKEDFDQDVSFRKPVSPSLLPNPCNNKIKETQSHDGLDFKLSF